MESKLFSAALYLVENGYSPDCIVRRGVRTLIKNRFDEENKGVITDRFVRKQNFIRELKSQPIAISTTEANEQHYELPSEFFCLTLDKKFLKYSSCYFGYGDSTHEIKTLEDAAEAMLNIYIDRAQVKDGMDILDLGCGWGSLSLFLAEKFPNAKITSVSNSNTQRTFIQDKQKEKGIYNITVITADINTFEISLQFDRIISIEMFEHMKNYEALLHKISKWLKPNGKLFVHIFSHHSFAYNFIAKSASDWLSKYFFTNGTMLSDESLLYFQRDLCLSNHWIVDGRNYGETSEHWLRNLDKNKNEVLKIFSNTYGKENAIKWYIRWRLFFISVAELFNYNNGQQWIISHYLFEKRTLAKL